MNNPDNFHERFDNGEDIKIGSARAFGIIFSTIFAVIALWPMSRGSSINFWSAILSSFFLLTAIFNPGLLSPLNRLWFKLGMLLHKIVNPIVMGFLFFLTVTPIAIIFKLIGKDPLNRELDQKCKTYWIERDPNEFHRDSMKNQF